MSLFSSAPVKYSSFLVVHIEVNTSFMHKKLRMVYTRPVQYSPTIKIRVVRIRRWQRRRQNYNIQSTVSISCKVIKSTTPKRNEDISKTTRPTTHTDCTACIKIPSVHTVFLLRESRVEFIEPKLRVCEENTEFKGSPHISANVKKIINLHLLLWRFMIHFLEFYLRYAYMRVIQLCIFLTNSI